MLISQYRKQAILSATPGQLILMFYVEIEKTLELVIRDIKHGQVQHSSTSRRIDFDTIKSITFTCFIITWLICLLDCGGLSPTVGGYYDFSRRTYPK